MQHIGRRRVIIVYILFCLITVLLAFRVGWVQVVSGDRLSKLATEQQVRDVPIPARRGVIYDRHGKELAVSAATYSIWARPGQIKGDSRTDEKLEETAGTLAEILNMDKNAISAILNQKKSLVKIAKYIEKDKADKIRKKGLIGIEVSEDVKRFYPLGPFAANLLGSTTDDNRGLAGIELAYDRYLSGIPGRWIESTDRDGGGLSYGREKYYQEKDGLNVVLTIDEVIQHYVENALDTVQQKTQADRVMAIVMDPKTGDVLAMGMTPDYDPNNPRVPLATSAAAYVDSLPDQDKMNYWNAMWRNPMVSDTYEPGSTFKLITTAIALEERATSPNDSFYDTGSINVSGTKLHCWRWQKPHGQETLVQAVENSCNPVFVQLAQRVGYDKYFEYLDLFGFTNKTGIDFPGEGQAIIQTKENAGPVGLATMAYGQGIAVTPIQLITAVSAFGNEGKLMQPRLVKELTDSSGRVIEEFRPKVVRQVVSKETADEMDMIMEATVGEGTGAKAKISGYRIGGKTGTANKAEAGGYSEETYSSFVGMAPMDNPKVSVLLIVDNPKGEKSGSLTATPGVKDILENTLRYMKIKPYYSKEDEQTMADQMVTAPDVTNMSFSQAKNILQSVSLNYQVATSAAAGTDFTVVDQYPKAGDKVAKNGTVWLYNK